MIDITKHHITSRTVSVPCFLLSFAIQSEEYEKKYFPFSQTVCFPFVASEKCFLYSFSVRAIFLILRKIELSLWKKKRKEIFHFTKFALCKYSHSTFLFFVVWFYEKKLCFVPWRIVHENFPTYLIHQRMEQSYFLWKPIMLWIKHYDAIAHIDFSLNESVKTSL